MQVELKAYLESHGHTNVFCDVMPDPSKIPDCIAVFKYNHIPDGDNCGSGRHYIQVQVRRATYQAAQNVCRGIFALLNSGENERIIDLTDTVWAHIKQRKGPLLLNREAGNHTFYCEVVLWGDN